MSDVKIEKVIEALLVVILLGFLFYGLHKAGNDRSFDNACENLCMPERSITPYIDFQDQCLCDEGHGKWRYQDVKRAD